MANISIYYFCVDGGGTKSIAALYDLNGKILAKSKTNSGNIYNDANKVVENINILWFKLEFNNYLKWCPGADLNHRHKDFQSSALPTELPGRI